MTDLKISSKRKPVPLNNSGFMKSTRAEEIRDLIQQYKGKMSNARLHRKIKELDPKVPGYIPFCKFMQSLDEANNKRAVSVLNTLKDVINEDEDTGEEIMRKLLDNAYKKIFVAGNIAINQELQDIMEQVQKGEKLTREQQKVVMDWFFKAQDARVKQRTVDLKSNADERAETLMDNLILGAQYQAYDPADVVDGEYEEIDKGLQGKNKVKSDE